MGLGDSILYWLCCAFTLKSFQDIETNKIIVLGGTQPGQSTNAVAALCAEAINADLFINATNVDGVYTSDPHKKNNVKKLDIVKTSELIRLIYNKELFAGSYELFDPLAIKIVERSKIPTRILNGSNPKNIEDVINGKSLGTLVISSLI